MEEKRKVVWSDSAIRNLKENYDFIFQDSKKHAELVRIEIIEASLNLEDFPSLGREVPEVKVESFREIFVGNYRLMYEVFDDTILITHILHMSKRFK